MTNQPYDDLLPEVIPYVRDCPEIVALNALRNAAIEFCDKSHWYTFVHDPMLMVAGVSQYEFVPPDDTVVARITQAWLNQMPLKLVSEDYLNRVFPLNWQQQQGGPQYITHVDDPTLFWLVPQPATGGDTLTMTVALKPSRDSISLDCGLVERWTEQLSFGARARLYDTPGQPYFDLQQAAFYRAKFISAISEAKIERNRSLTRGTLRVRNPTFV